MPYLPPGQRAIELGGLFRVVQAPLTVLSAFLVQVRDLLETRMKITSYNQHLGSFPPERLGRFCSNQSTRPARSRPCHAIIQDALLRLEWDSNAAAKKSPPAEADGPFCLKLS